MSQIWQQINVNWESNMSPMQGSGIVFSLGQQRSCESESNISKLFSQILWGTFQKKRTKLWGHCVITLSCREHGAYHCVTRSHNPAEVGGTLGSHVNAGEEEQGVDRALSATSLTKWHHRSELRLHSCLVAGDNGAHAWTRRSSKRMRRTSLPPLVPRKTMVPPRSHYAHLECRERGRRQRKRGAKKSIWFHSSLTRRLTDGDLPPLNKGKETAWPQSHKTAQSGC